MGKLSANRIKFSWNSINNLPDCPPNKARENYKDTACDALTCSVMLGGDKILCVYYRVQHASGSTSNAYYKLGKYRSWDIDEARQEAMECVQKGREGWNYSDYKRHISKQISDEKAKEQIAVSLDGIGELPGQIGYAWINHCDHKDGITERHQRRLRTTYQKYVYEHFGDTAYCVDVSEKDIIAFKNKFVDRKVSFNRVRKELVMCFDREIKERRLTYNIIRNIKPFPEKVSRVVLTDDGAQEAFKFFSSLENFEEADHNHVRFLLMVLMTGQRPIILRSLLKKDDGESNFVDWERKELVIRQHKTDKRTASAYETVPLHDRAYDVLKAASDANPRSRYAIPPLGPRSMRSDRQISEANHRDIFNKYKDRFETQGTGKLTIYKLRHTFATMLLKNGVPLHVVGSMLLHAPNSPATTIYAQILEDTRYDAIKVAGTMFGKTA